MTTLIQPLLFQGTLLNRNGNAIPDARIQLWQTDLDGNYLHPLPGAAGSPPNPDNAYIVDDFQYFGTDATDSNGKFEFLTYRPGIYPNRPYSHFHFMVWLEEPIIGEETGEELLPALWTQFYFEGGAPPNSPEMLELAVTDVVDSGVYNYGSYVNGTIVVDDGSVGGGTLLPVSPTQPQGPFYPETNFFSMDNDLTTTTADNTDVTTQTDSLTKEPTLNPVSDSPTTTMPVTDTISGTNSPTTKQSGSNPVITNGPTTKQLLTLSPVTKNDDTATSTAPTLQPVQSASSSASASLHSYSWGLLGIWLVVYHAFLRRT